MKLHLSLLITLAGFGTAHAQTIPDTLDHRRYQPLSIGYEWQYTTFDFVVPIPPYERVWILADTVSGYLRLDVSALPPGCIFSTSRQPRGGSEGGHC